MPANNVDEYPSLLWITIPSILLVSGYFARKWYLAYRLKKYGIGRGAPGFQTNVRKVQITPEIAARLRRGEEVSAEEITAAIAKAEENRRLGIDENTTSGSPASTPEPPTRTSVKEEPVNEWLPESVTSQKKRGKGKRR
ncbi:hypothetical protein ONZ45_g7196 [Pleurotus djamor]|nr:hypothetical protein ONZ45_g7196 [Pleurotus djamor]